MDPDSCVQIDMNGETVTRDLKRYVRYSIGVILLNTILNNLNGVKVFEEYQMERIQCGIQKSNKKEPLFFHINFTCKNFLQEKECKNEKDTKTNNAAHVEHH